MTKINSANMSQTLFSVVILAMSFLADSAPTSPKPCRVLSLSGGGSYGAFEVGVMKKLVEEDPDLDYDYITGVSAGALNAGFLSMYPMGNFSSGLRDLEAAMSTIKSNSDVYTDHNPFNILIHKSIYNTAPLRKFIDKAIAGKTVQRAVTIGITNIGTGSQDQVSETELAKDPATVMMASSAIPLLFPPVKYQGGLFSDGGTVANSIVVQGVERCPAGAPIKLDIITCDPAISKVDPNKYSFGQLATRTIDIVDKALFSNFLRFKCTNGQTSNVKARHYYPTGDDNKISALDFTQLKFIQNAGYTRAQLSTFDFCP